MSEKELERMLKKIQSELEPFLDGVRTKHADFMVLRQAYGDFITRHVRANRILGFLLEDLHEPSDYKAKEEIHRLFAYLGCVESLCMHA